MIRFGIRAHDMGKYEIKDFSELLKLVKSLDGECIQLALNKSFIDFTYSEEKLNKEFANFLSEKLKENGIDISVLGCYINLTDTDEKNRRKSLDKFKAHLYLSKLLNTSLVGTETGCFNTTYTYTKLNATEEAFELFLKSVKELVEHAENLNTNLAIEGVAKHIIATPEKMHRALKTIDSENLKVIFDPVNFLTVDNYREQREIIVKSFKLFGDKIEKIHLKDFIIKDGEIKAVPIGKGMFDVEFFMSELQKYKDDIDILLENSTVDTAKECIRFVKQYLK